MKSSIINELKTSKTYVMKGNFYLKQLDIYHLIFAPSYLCNLRCSHCYLPNHAEMTVPGQRMLSLIDEWSEIVMSERGQYRGIFHLKGGEPLLLPYFNKVIDKISSKRTLQFMLTTNGTCYTKETIGKLSRLNEIIDGNVSIIVSLDGSNEEINSILRHSGNFSNTITFAKLLNDAGITFFLNYVVHRYNIDDIPYFMNLACELGASQVNFLSFVPKGFGKRLKQLRLDPLKIFNKIHNVWANGDDKIKEMLSGSISDIIHQENCDKCIATECVGGYRGLMYIVPNGDVFSCPNLNFNQFKVGNILKHSCSELLEKIQGDIYNCIHITDIENGPRFQCKGDKFILESAYYMNEDIIENKEGLNNSNNRNEISFCFSRNF